MANFTAFYDACIFYPVTVRNLFMELAVTDLFKAKWSEAIHEEWMRSLKKDRPDIPEAAIEHIRMLINDNVRDCLVHDSDYYAT